MFRARSKFLRGDAAEGTRGGSEEWSETDRIDQEFHIHRARFKSVPENVLRSTDISRTEAIGRMVRPPKLCLFAALS
jgi:hypothetical protein